MTIWEGTAEDRSFKRGLCKFPEPEIVPISGRNPWLYLKEPGQAWKRWEITAGANEDDPLDMTLINENPVTISTSETSMGVSIRGGTAASPRWARLMNLDPDYQQEPGGYWCESGNIFIKGGVTNFDVIHFNGGVIPNNDDTDTRAEIFNRKGRIKDCGEVWIAGMIDLGEAKYEDWNSSGISGSITEQDCWKGETKVVDERGFGGNGHGGGDANNDVANSSPGGPPIVRQHKIYAETWYQGFFAQLTRGTTSMDIDLEDVWIKGVAGTWPSGVGWGNSPTSYRGLYWFNQDVPNGLLCNLRLRHVYADRTDLNPGGIGTYPANTVTMNTVVPQRGAVILGPDPRGYPVDQSKLGVGYVFPGVR